ncbi:MAG: acyl-CoA dehydrogenase, partial [Hyphomicrobiaceae bacterium]
MAEAALSRTTNFENHAAALAAAERVLALAKEGVRGKQAAAKSADAGQHALHGLAWLATYVEAIRQMLGWAKRMSGEGRFGEMEGLLLDVAFGEYLAQIAGGIPMSQVEMVRLGQLGVSPEEAMRFAADRHVADLIARGGSEEVKARIAELIADQPGVTTFGDSGLDETHSAMREQMRKFAEDKVLPNAHD